MKVNTMDTVVGTNSGFNDDNLEYLSAEEKACLMFLEETIDALDAEDDSGVANQESDSMPPPGNLATRVANLSASMSLGKLTDISIFRKAEPMNKMSKDHNHILNYLVPTPLVLANGSSNFVSHDRKGGFTLKTFAKPTPAQAKNQPQPAPRSLPSEVNVVVIPPPSKVSGNLPRASRDISATHQEPKKLQKKPLQTQPLQQSGSPRGPLSYEGLVKLRKTGSIKKDPDSSDTQHNNSPVVPAAEDKNSHGQPGVQKPGPAVAPKPIKIPVSVSSAPGCPQTDSTVMNPQKVRMEALYKLGLLKDQEASTTGSCVGKDSAAKWANPPTCPQPPQPSSPPHRHLPAIPVPVPDPPRSRPPPVPVRSQETRSKLPLHWASMKVYHRSLSDLSSGPNPMTVPKPLKERSATLERCGPGLHGDSFLSKEMYGSSQRPTGDGKTGLSHWRNSILQNGKPSDSLVTVTGKDSKDGKSNEEGSPPPTRRKSQEYGVKGQMSNHPVTHTVLMVPPMDEDRREALIKLGLLKI